MSENNIFIEEEIIWAKIEGYPWWPSIIISKNKDIKSDDYIYTIVLIGSYIIRNNITKKYIAKFDKNYNYYFF